MTKVADISPPSIIEMIAARHLATTATNLPENKKN
jgi:hypothetical protein